MLGFLLAADESPSAENAGFCSGSLAIFGERREIVFDKLMVVLTVGLLMDQLIAWLARGGKKGVGALDFRFLDLGEAICFNRNKDQIEISHRGKIIDSSTVKKLLTSFMEAARNLDDEFVGKLPNQDAAKQSFYASIDAFERFLIKLS